MSTQSTNIHNFVNPHKLADEIGLARAEVAEAKAKLKALEDTFKSHQFASGVGEFFEVTASYGVESKRVSWQDVAKKLNPSRQLVTANTKVVTSNRLSVIAIRKGG